MSARVLLAVDGNSLVHRSFHAQNGIGLRSQNGQSIWAVRGLLTQLVAAVERVGAEAVLVGFDDPVRSVRRERWPQYKATRTDKAETLVSQLLLAASVLGELGVSVIRPAGLEADDVLCSAAAYAKANDMRAVVMTSDRDSFALIDDNTRVLRIINGGVEASPLLTCDRLVTMIGVRPDQYRDFAALRGDPSDNLPGVTGIGPKTAARLLVEFGTAAAVFDDIEVGGAGVIGATGPGVAAKLADPQARQRWLLNCQVMQMHADVPVIIGPGDGFLPVPESAVRAAFTEHQLIANLPNALRVLAHCEPPANEKPVITQAHVPAYRQPGQARFGPLPKPTPAKLDQLSLF